MNRNLTGGGPDRSIDECAKIEETTILQGLYRDQKYASDRLKQINEAIDALEKNPDVADILIKLSKVRNI